MESKYYIYIYILYDVACCSSANKFIEVRRIGFWFSCTAVRRASYSAKNKA